jgi:hypothetical protein
MERRISQQAGKEGGINVAQKSRPSGKSTKVCINLAL